MAHRIIRLQRLRRAIERSYMYSGAGMYSVSRRLCAINARIVRLGGQL